MTHKIKEYYHKLSLGEKIYAGAMIPTWLSFVIYMMIGVPIFI